MVGAVVVAEIACHALFRYLFPIPQNWEIVLDAVVLLVIMAAVYKFMYRPFKAHWDQLQRSLRENSQLYRQLIHAAEDERRRLARDIHDECGQNLAALQLGMATLGHTLAPQTPELQNQICKLIDLTTQLGDHIRDVSAKLRPVMLESVGLAPTLRMHVQQLAGQPGNPNLRFQLEGSVARLPWELEITLFRVCQEALNNVIKHAGAKRAYISLTFDAKQVRLAIEDNGTGFDLDKLQKAPHGMGLLGIRERIASLGGKLNIASRPGKDTLVKVEIPRYWCAEK
jgi:signal transduction histidine kinase